MSATHVALLRGINVGGRHKLPMQLVREVLDGAGLGPVRTHIQSGNVLLHDRTAAGPAPSGNSATSDLAVRVRELLERVAGFTVPTVVVTADELREALAANPYSPTQPKLEHVVFLAEQPDSGLVARLMTLRDDLGGTDDLTVHGRWVYLDHPDGLLQSQLAARATALLKDGTARNLATVQKLVELLDDH